MLKLFTPQEARDQNTGQQTRDIMRTQEIKEEINKSQRELALHEANFSKMLASQRARWAKEEEEHSVRVSEMTNEIRHLQQNKDELLIPIDLELKKAQNITREAERKLAEASKIKPDVEYLRDLFEEKWDEVVDREEQVGKAEKKLLVKKEGMKLEQELISKNHQSVLNEWASFNEYKKSQEKLIKEEYSKLRIIELAQETKTKELEAKEKDLHDREIKLQDGRETLARAYKRIGKKPYKPI